MERSFIHTLNVVRLGFTVGLHVPGIANFHLHPTSPNGHMWHACAFIITHYISILFHSGLNSEQQNGQADPTVQQQVKLSKFRLSTNVVSLRSPE